MPTRIWAFWVGYLLFLGSVVCVLSLLAVVMMMGVELGLREAVIAMLALTLFVAPFFIAPGAVGAWMVAGRITMRVYDSHIEWGHSLWRFQRTRTYPARHIRSLRIYQFPTWPRPVNLYFDYGPQTIAFGGGVSAETLQHLYNTICTRFPNYATPNHPTGATLPHNDSFTYPIAQLRPAAFTVSHAPTSITLDCQPTRGNRRSGLFSIISPIMFCGTIALPFILLLLFDEQASFQAFLSALPAFLAICPIALLISSPSILHGLRVRQRFQRLTFQGDSISAEGVKAKFTGGINFPLTSIRSIDLIDGTVLPTVPPPSSRRKFAGRIRVITDRQTFSIGHTLCYSDAKTCLETVLQKFPQYEPLIELV